MITCRTVCCEIQHIEMFTFFILIVVFQFRQPYYLYLISTVRQELSFSMLYRTVQQSVAFGVFISLCCCNYVCYCHRKNAAATANKLGAAV